MTARERLLSHHPGGDIRLLCGAVHKFGTGHEFVRAHHATVEPMDNATASGAANHADVSAIDFDGNIGDVVLYQTKCIWDFCSLQHDSHCNVLPGSGRNAARGKSCNAAHRFQSEQYAPRYSYGVLSSSYVNADRGIADLGCEVPQ